MEIRIKFLSYMTAGLCLLLSVASCQQEKEHIAPAIWGRDSVSTMVSYGVNALISDSGVIKYRIVTERWDYNIVKNPQKQSFEKGIFLEQFDEKFNIQAYIQADTAYYYDQKKLWELRGRVTLRNLDGLVFRSEELFWDGLSHELYSYKFSHVITPLKEIQGSYFRSDEHMSHYIVTNSKGSMEKNDFSSAPQQKAPQAPGDTAHQQLRNPAVAKPKTAVSLLNNQFKNNKVTRNAPFKPRLSNR